MAEESRAAVRLWEIDLARGIAIAMMVIYHAAWNVDALAAPDLIDPFSGGWRALQIVCGSSFLMLVGISLAVSNARHRRRGVTGWALYRRHLERALQVAAAALLVSVVTLVALGDDHVRFGILHCIALAMVVGPLLLRLGVLLPAVGLAVLVAGLWLADQPPQEHAWLVPFGVPLRGGAGVDWYPILPWFAPVLLGLWLGRVLYPNGQRGRWGRRWPAGGRWADRAGWPGRHALPIYLLHQPLLLPLVAGILLLAGVELSDQLR